MILDALFLTKEQLQERKAVEAEKKLRKEEERLKKEEKNIEVFFEKVKVYKNITLLNSNFEPFYVWGIKKSEKKVLCIFPDDLPGYCTKVDYDISWLESCKKRYLKLTEDIKILEQKKKEDEQEKS